MTWDEFKNEVDEKLKEMGYDGSLYIYDIDLIDPQNGVIIIDVENGRMGIGC